MRAHPRRPLLCALAGASAIGVAGCATARQPVVYPNAQYRAQGEAAAQRDAEECMRLAQAHGAGEGAGARVARDSAQGAVVGAAAGAVLGSFGANLGRGALAGAATGGAAALTRSLLTSDSPDPTHQRFVERCMAERGYDVIGWE